MRYTQVVVGNLGYVEFVDQRNELGEFLRARRAVISPAQAGLPRDEPRRVEGLRREEVAMMAGVSIDYYTRLEQGRERRPSEQVLQAIARALRLDGHATNHLVHLVWSGSGAVVTRQAGQVSSGAAAIVNDVIAAPAMVLSPALDVLACNSLAAALYSDFAQVDNLARMVFLDPAAGEFYAVWESVARDTVGNLRAASVSFREDSRIAEIVGELNIRSTAFTALWIQHDVRPRSSGVKQLRHGRVGELSLCYDTLSVGDAPGQQLLIYRAEAGSASADGLALLDLPDSGHAR